MKKLLTLKSGKTYNLVEFTQKMGDEYLEWAKTALPDPLEGLTKSPVFSKLTPRLQEVAVKAAVQCYRKPLAADGQEMEALQRTKEGATKMIEMVYKPYNPTLTIDEILEINKQALDEFGEGYLEKLPVAE